MSVRKDIQKRELTYESSRCKRLKIKKQREIDCRQGRRDAKINMTMKKKFECVFLLACLTALKFTELQYETFFLRNAVVPKSLAMMDVFITLK